MKKEIGGYLQLEEFSGKEYYPNLYKVNLGRTALLWLIRSRKCKKLLLPYYLCDSVTSVCEASPADVEYYHLDKNLNPLIHRPQGLEEGEYLYLVNYYGQLTDEKIRTLSSRFKRIIVDHTHSFFQRPLPHVDTLYSCRKFFGLSDGAYLSTDADMLPIEKQDVSYDRMEHILGRYELDAGTFYQKMLDNAAGYHHSGIAAMSKLTSNLLKAIDYEAVRIKREDNYKTLLELLPPCRENPFTAHIPSGPFAYPYLSKNGPALRKLLAAEKIFVPVNWSNVTASQPEDSLEYHWAADILPLPCDQRYNAQDMEYMVRKIKEAERIC